MSDGTFIGNDEEGQPIMLKPAPDPSLSLIRELRDALVHEHALWIDESGQKCTADCKVNALIARATAYLREHGAEAQAHGPGGGNDPLA